MSKKIDFDNIFLDPINNFYKKIGENIKLDINGLILSKINNSKINFDKQNKLQSEIDQNEISIQDFYIQNNIKKRKVQNVFIGMSFILIFGLAFYEKYFQNRKLIQEYKDLNNTLLSINKSNNIKIAKYNRISFSCINSFDLLEEILSEKGFSKIEPFNDYIFLNQIIDYWNNNNLTSLCLEIKGIQFLIRNNPVYDLVIKVLDIVEVETTNSKFFSYDDIENYVDAQGNNASRNVTKNVELRAFHIEKTPFITEENMFIFKTNFCKNLVFNPQKPGSKFTKFENNEFNQIYHISESNNKIELNNFFTINAQENFVKWFKVNNSFYDFKKIYDSFIIYPEPSSNGQIEDLKFLNELCFNKNCFFSIPNNIKDFNDMKEIIINKFTNYLKKISCASILPLLSPSISRECYIKNREYLLINNYKEYLSDDNKESLSEDKNNFLLIINKFNRSLYFYFLKFQAAKPCWFSLIEARTLNEKSKLTKYLFNLKSYRKEILVDIVTVTGGKTGPRDIPVEYEKFFPIKETKICYYIPFPKNNNFFRDKILINKNFNLNDFYYIDNEDSNFLKNNYIWFNNFAYSEKIEEDMLKIKKINNQFKKIIESNNLHANIFIDYSGLYLNINQKIGLEIENYIVELLDNIDLS